jgi:hypothetical protein
MRWSILFLAISAWGQTFSVTPAVARQGETLKVTSDKTAHSARLHGRTIILFPQEDGRTLGLMPVPVLEKPGAYQLEFLDEKGAVLHHEPVTVTNAHYPKQNIVIAPSIAGLKPSPGEQETVNDFRKTVSSVRYWQEPLRAPEPGCLTSPFGVMRLHNGKPTGDYHAGVDHVNSGQRNWLCRHHWTLYRPARALDHLRARRRRRPQPMDDLEKLPRGNTRCNPNAFAQARIRTLSECTSV